MIIDLANDIIFHEFRSHFSIRFKRGEPFFIAHFAEPDNTQPGKRVFDISLQGASVAANVDIAREAGGRYMAVVREFRGVVAGASLHLKLTPKTGRPVLSGIEVVAEENVAAN